MELVGLALTGVAFGVVLIDKRDALAVKRPPDGGGGCSSDLGPSPSTLAAA